MTAYTMRGGPFDGEIRDVPHGVWSVAFPMVATSTGNVSRSLAELEPEVRFDYETGAIVAPHDLVLTVRQAYYDLVRGEFVYRDTP